MAGVLLAAGGVRAVRGVAQKHGTHHIAQPSALVRWFRKIATVRGGDGNKVELDAIRLPAAWRSSATVRAAKARRIMILSSGWYAEMYPEDSSPDHPYRSGFQVDRRLHLRRTITTTWRHDAKKETGSWAMRST